jgi:hypothetical protein
LAIVTTLLLASMAVSTGPAGADETVPPEEPAIDKAAVRDAVLKGLDWLSERQAVDGNWGVSVGVTGLVVICYAGAGYDHTNKSVQRGLSYMRNFYSLQDGYLADAFLNYETAISLMALSAANDPDDVDKLQPLSDFMVNFQFGGHSGLNESQWWYVGGWPNHAGIPDLSNSQFTLLALQSSRLMNPSIDVPDRVFKNNTAFTKLTQNWPDVNTFPWAQNESLPSHGDGGFVYNSLRSRTELGEQMFESYGSITAAGLYAYLVGGHDPTNPEVAVARQWLDINYDLQENPRLAGKGFYYYLWTQARVLAMSPQDWVVDGAGKLRNWRTDLAERFLGLQQPDGGWPGNPQSGWREEEPELASMYALFALETSYLLVPNPRLELEVSGADSVRFLTLDGEELMTDASRGIEVTGNGFSATDPELFRKLWIDLDGAEGGTATVSAIGSWGEDRQVSATENVELGKAGARVFVATGGFAGPFGIHMLPFDRGPELSVDHKGTLSLERGKTAVIDFDLSETTGENALTGINLVSDLVGGAIADVDDQGISVAKGGSTTLTLTISVPADAPTGNAGNLIFTSSTGTPVVIPVKYIESEDEGGPPSQIYWIAIGALFVIVVVFIALPRLGRGR